MRKSTKSHKKTHSRKFSRRHYGGASHPGLMGALPTGREGTSQPGRWYNPKAVAQHKQQQKRQLDKEMNKQNQAPGRGLNGGRKTHRRHGGRRKYKKSRKY